MSDHNVTVFPGLRRPRARSLTSINQDGQSTGQTARDSLSQQDLHQQAKPKTEGDDAAGILEEVA
jgi:hypothetical protein